MRLDRNSVIRTREESAIGGFVIHSNDRRQLRSSDALPGKHPGICLTSGAKAITRDIQPLTPDDISELSTFLIAGFHAKPEADFISSDVLL